MTTLCTTTQNALGQALLNGVNYTADVSVKIALFTADPTDSGSFVSEITDAGYARQAMTFDAFVGGISQNDTIVEFGPWVVDAPVPITHVGICAPAGSTMRVHGSLTAAKQPNAGDYLRFNVGNLSMQLR